MTQVNVKLVAIGCGTITATSYDTVKHGIFLCLTAEHMFRFAKNIDEGGIMITDFEWCDQKMALV